MASVKSPQVKKLAPYALGPHIKISNQANHKNLSYKNIMALVKSTQYKNQKEFHSNVDSFQFDICDFNFFWPNCDFFPKNVVLLQDQKFYLLHVQK